MHLDIHARLVTIPEDDFCLPPSEQLVAVTERAAQCMNFTQDYLVFASKKRAIQTNPWAGLIAAVIHPVTKQPCILINEVWFSTLNEDEQTFLLARYFAVLIHGLKPPTVQAIEYVPFAVQAMIFPVYFALNKTSFSHSHMLLKLAASQMIVSATQVLINKPYCWLYNKMQYRHEVMLDQLALQRTGKPQAARHALECIDSYIEQEIAAGDPFFLPYQHRFSQLAQAVLV